MQAHNVGVARAAGFAAVLAREAGRPAEQMWLATTDADSTVPADWLAEQLRLAAKGAEVVAGTVRVQDWSEQPAAARDRFHAGYGRPGRGHLHVHGANLGMSATAYLDAGGIPPRWRWPRTRLSSMRCADTLAASSPPVVSRSPPAAGAKAAHRAASPTTCVH